MNEDVILSWLLGIGLVANFLWVFVGNLAGLPGALIGGLSPSRPVWRFRLGVLVAFLGQTYVGLAFAAWVVSWARLAVRAGAQGVILWPFAFLVVAVPVWMGLIHARVEATELQQANAQVEAIHLTTLVVILGFIVFAVFPAVAATGWHWVPLVISHN